jgi:hypothetical protein
MVGVSDKEPNQCESRAGSRNRIKRGSGLPLDRDLLWYKRAIIYQARLSNWMCAVTKEIF